VGRRCGRPSWNSPGPALPGRRPRPSRQGPGCRGGHGLGLGLPRAAPGPGLLRTHSTGSPPRQATPNSPSLPGSPPAPVAVGPELRRGGRADVGRRSWGCRRPWGCRRQVRQGNGGELPLEERDLNRGPVEGGLQESPHGSCLQAAPIRYPRWRVCRPLQSGALRRPVTQKVSFASLKCVDGRARAWYSDPPVGMTPKVIRQPKETFQRSDPSGTVLRSTRHQHRL